jgi:hypothetical protein
MAREAIEFDAQCDLAALVYGKPDEPDPKLREFVQDLMVRGYRVVGLIQTRLGDGSAAVTVLPTGKTISFAQTLGAVPSSSSLGGCDLAVAAARIDALIDSGVDLVIINRFGKLEAEGAGLVDEIARAVSFDIPVVVAVPEFFGMAVLLPRHGGQIVVPERQPAELVGRDDRRRTALGTSAADECLRAVEMRSHGSDCSR